MDRFRRGWNRAALTLVLCWFGGHVQAAENGKAVSTVPRLRIRSEAGLSGQIVGHLAKGESVSLLQKSTFSVKADNLVGPWYEIVNGSGVRGWVFGGYLRLLTGKEKTK